MEMSDIHVRVLFDFEYTTKDGSQVKIKEGEKLYLIKKTNEDWWQVIRNSGRPFYVPANYIEEIPRTSYSTERKPNQRLNKSKSQVFENCRIRSCSVESQQTHESHRIKPVIPKRTVFDIKHTIPVREPFSFPKYSRNENDTDTDEEADYVNIQKPNLEQNFETSTKKNHNSDQLSAANNVDRLLENINNNLMSVDDEFRNGYSHVTVKSCSLSPINYEEQLNLSNSLEELTQQIEWKAKSIGGPGTNSGYSKIDKLIKSMSKDMPVPAKNLSSELNTCALGHIKESSIKNDDKNKLQYSGSFKTKHEREKWAKNYGRLSSTREEDLDGDINQQDDEVVKENNDDNNNLNTGQSNDNVFEDRNVNVNVVNEINRTRSDSSDNANDDKSVGSDSKMSVEKSDTRVSTSSVSEQNERVQQPKCSFDSSIEDLDKNYSNYVNVRLTPSDKGSMDSLLDADSHLSIQEGSICTTASDSFLHTSDTSEECLSSILREEPPLEESHQRKKAALKRNNRVECRVRYPIKGSSPPVPEENQQPTRELFAGWCEYTYADDRTFFYNSKTGEKSWKPPRRRCNTDDKGSRCNGSVNNLYSGSSSPFAETDENVTGPDFSDVIVPPGWRLETDLENSCQCYINILTGAKWFSSNDNEGRVYYFEENSSESTWTLPVAVTASAKEKPGERINLRPENHTYSNLPPVTRNNATSNESVSPSFSASRSDNRSKSMLPVETKEETEPISMKYWPQLSHGVMVILKEGTLNKTKITENGKRVRKNWSSSHVVLTELFLLFFKDAKSFAAMQKTGVASRPEMSVDLNGALIDRGDKVSSRKNVYIISTILGLQVLIQNDSTQQADSWLLAIQAAIKNLPSGFDSCPRLTRGSNTPEESVPDTESKKVYKVTRTKSIKSKNKDGSIEDLTVSPAERQTKIKARLKKFFNRRPTMELLVKKGIWKDEPAFGCYLDQAAGNESPRVPPFVQRCISCIERSEENMKTDGLYRASGNLSQVQKIRLQVDQNNLSVIEEEEDVHVLTGALKLFFRELKEPLIPYVLFNKAIKASHNHNKKEKIVQFREITKALPTANYDTLKFLLQHLLKVTKYKEYNRMHIPNLAIVFGPTLMWPEQESNNMALDLMQQNLVIECLLVDYDNIFR